VATLDDVVPVLPPQAEANTARKTENVPRWTQRIEVSLRKAENREVTPN
jgi:hypothetical protein